MRDIRATDVMHWILALPMRDICGEFHEFLGTKNIDLLWFHEFFLSLWCYQAKLACLLDQLALVAIILCVIKYHNDPNF